MTDKKRVPRGNPTGGEFANRDRTASDVDLGDESKVERLKLDHADALELQARMIVGQARRRFNAAVPTTPEYHAALTDHQDAVRAWEVAKDYAVGLRNPAPAAPAPGSPGTKEFAYGVVEELTRRINTSGQSPAGSTLISLAVLHNRETQSLMRAAVDAALEAQSSGRTPEFLGLWSDGWVER